MKVLSTAFEDSHYIPAEYTCGGANINPPLTFSEVPQDTMSLTLIVDDPDAPSGTFTHWLIYDMSQATMQILEHDLPQTGTQGKNDFGNIGYDGPCPPSGIHRYFFKLFALKSMLNLAPGATRAEVDAAMRGNTILQTAELIGLYEKSEDQNPRFADWDKNDYTDDRNTSTGQVIKAR